MAIPFLNLLPATARIAYPFIQSGVRAGLSSRAIERTIRAAGFKISRGRSILPLMRELRVREAAGRIVSTLPKSSVINVASLPDSITKISNNYSHRVSVRGLDSAGNAVDTGVTVVTDRDDLTVDQVEQIAAHYVSEQGISDTVYDAVITLESSMKSVAME